MHIRAAILAAMLLSCWPCALLAQTTKASQAHPLADPLLESEAFLSGHPDLRYRLLGLEKQKRGNLEDAFRFFQRAALYADKPSQGMVAEMLWTGRGTKTDKAMAYAWMDLAAERGYTIFAAHRERYWNELDRSERSRAIEIGQAVYAQYADVAGEARLAAALRRTRAQLTGSRTGFVHNLKIYIPGPGGFQEIDGSRFHDPKYWDPAEYRAWHDAVWMNPRIGRVSVGAVETLLDSSSNPAPAPAHGIPDRPEQPWNP